MGWSGRSAAPRLSTYFCHLASDSAVSPTSTRNRGSRLLYAPRSQTGPVVDRPCSRSPRILSPPLPPSFSFSRSIHAGEKNGSSRSIFRDSPSRMNIHLLEIGRRETIERDFDLRKRNRGRGERKKRLFVYPVSNI